MDLIINVAGDLHLHFAGDPDADSAALERIERKIGSVHRLERKQMAGIADIQAEVTETRSVVDGAVALIGSLADRIEEAAGDEAATAELVAELRDQREDLAAAIAANTAAEGDGSGETGGTEEPAPTEGGDTGEGGAAPV